MYPAQLLKNEEIFQWNDIEGNYSNSSILLGNGFSLNFSESLRYKFLYESFIKECTPFARALFEIFDTKNFENILNNIEITSKVCEVLGSTVPAIDEIQMEIKQGLINSINIIHPKPIDIKKDVLLSISSQMKRFNNIFTTNYDLFLYYIILEMKGFGDHFFTAYEKKYKFFEEPDVVKNNHIYYLHGALFLFTNGYVTFKRVRDKDELLLNLITEEITNGNYPVFISEGSSKNKLKSIRNNQYLDFCLSRFENNKDKSLVIFGQSLSEQDFHIAQSIDNHYERVAVSLRTEEWSTIGELRAEKNRIHSQFKQVKCDFYDSLSLFDFKPKDINDLINELDV